MGSAAYDPDYVGTVNAEEKAEFQKKIVGKFSEELGQEIEGVMAEYIVVMVGNQKTMKEIHDEMIDFLGADVAESAVSCIFQLLVEMSAPRSSETAEASPVKETTAPSETSAPAKKIISLSAVKAPSSSEPSKSTIRVIGSSSNKDLKNALRSRSERFGIPEKKEETKPQRPNKPSITERLGAKVVDSKKDQQQQQPRNQRDRDNDRDRDSQRDRDNDRPQRENKKRKESQKGSDDQDNDRPPSKKSAKDSNDRHRGDNPHGPPRGNYPYPPPGYHGYPPPPYHMPPPEFMYPYHPPMPGYGYPPMHGGHYPPKQQAPPRRFNNKWVNPATVDNGAAASNGDGSTTTSGDGSTSSTTAAPAPGAAPNMPPAPRGFGYGYPRPRFQNKTWVRPDPKENNPAADEALSASLPKTP
ncbi:unnamed protein product [Aphanomyces euteiches]